MSQANSRQVATGRKSALMSVIGCRTNDTDLAGVMEEIEGYENIKVFSEMKQWVPSALLNSKQLTTQISSRRHPESPGAIKA